MVKENKTLVTLEIKNNPFSEIYLRKALFDVEQWMERFSVSKYIMLADTAKALHDNEALYGDGIYIGIEKRYLTRMVMSNFKTEWKSSEFTKYGFTYNVVEYHTKITVPVHIQFIQNDYSFFKFLDKRFYRTGQYKIPNPFEDYWKMKDKII